MLKTRHVVAGAALVGAGIVAMAGTASAHTVNVAWRCEGDGSVTFFAATYHGEGEGLSGGIVVDGTRYEFTSFVDPLPEDVTGQQGFQDGETEESVVWQVASVPSLAPGTHTITPTDEGSVEAPLGDYPFDAEIACGSANRRPVAVDDSATAAAGTATLIDVLANDSDPDGNFLNARIATQPTNGTVTQDSTSGRSLTYTPEPGFTGTDTFTYQAVDRDGAPSDPATVTVTVGGTAACAPGGPPAGAFDDVAASNVHAGSIDCLAWWGIVTGDGGDFHPADGVTRGQMASLVARLLTEAGVEAESTPPDAFDDDDDSVHEDAINFLAALDVIEGTSATEFGPSALVTRGQAASLIVRAFEVATGEALPAGPDAFDDDEDSVHEANINKAAAAGFINGVDADNFAPGDDIRRDQMTSILRRVLDRFVADGLATPPSS